MRTVSQVKNSQSRHRMNCRRRKKQQAPDVPDSSHKVHAVLSNNCSTLHWVRQNLHSSSHFVDQNNTLVDLAGKESDATKAKLKTSPVITKHLHSPTRVSQHFALSFFPTKNRNNTNEKKRKQKKKENMKRNASKRDERRGRSRHRPTKVLGVVKLIVRP